MLLIVSLISSWEWFPDVRGQVTGAVLACQAFNRGFWACFGLLYMNPKETKMIDVSGGNGIMFYPPEVGARVPTFCFILSSFVLIVGTTGALLIKRNEIQAHKDKVSFRRATDMNMATK